MDRLLWCAYVKCLQKSSCENDVDFFATMYNNECYLIPFSHCGKRAQRLRLVPTKNGQTTGIKFAKDYHLKDIVKNLKSQ